jgi:hypothetical protein
MRDEIGVPISKEFDKFAASIAAKTPMIVQAIQDIAPKIGAAANSIFTALATALTGDTKLLMVIGDAMGTAIAGGLKIGFNRTLREIGAGALGVGESLLQVFGGQGGGLAGATYGGPQVPQSNLGQMAGQAAGQLTGYEFQALSNQLSGILQYAQVIQGAGNQQFRLAQPGETSSIVDDLGRAIILLESINQNVKKPAFASP